MAAGSLVSRATGFGRSAVVAAALGVGLTADGYAVATAAPTIVYTLLMGGALNAVFVPELVRAAKEHEDGGTAYTDRLLTVCTAALLLITAGAVWAAPAIVAAYTDYTGAQADMTVALARYCLPQIFFLGLFTLLGQVLNARGRFGAMMWTPVLGLRLHRGPDPHQPRYGPHHRLDSGVFAHGQPEVEFYRRLQSSEGATHFVTSDKLWIGCVWELPPIRHERDAWIRHLLAPKSPI